jgi:uncharacterized membrane protein YfcA
MTQQPLEPTTTHQEDLTVQGQRRINVIWEVTQAIIAVMVVGVTMGVSAYAYIVQGNPDVPNLIAVAFGTIVGFYFARTNHQNIGGIGPKVGTR